MAWVGYHFLHDIRFLWMVRSEKMENLNVKISISGVEKLDCEIQNLDVKVREVYQAIHSVQMALEDLGVEINQPADGAAD